ncbi:MAG: hypothetical protein WCP15_02620 [bacterium]
MNFEQSINPELGLKEHTDSILQAMESLYQPEKGKSEKIMNTLKRYFALSVVGLTSFLVTGCGEQKGSTDTAGSGIKPKNE